MTDGAAITPDFGEYVRYCAGFCLRYFGVAGGLTLLLHVVLRSYAHRFRIQPRYPGRSEIGHEIRWSMSNAACTGLSTMLTLALARAGHTSLYTGMADYGWGWFFASIAAAALGYDAWFYWQHRLLHTPWMFEHVHAIHHRSVNPTPLATFAHHPVETFLGNLYFVLLVVLVPMHPLALGAAGAVIFGAGIVAHLGYEAYPRGFTRHPLLGWCNTATHHNLHHTEPGCNYGLWSQIWDRAMGTNHPAYHAVFDAMTESRGASRSAAAAAHAGGVSP